MAIKRVLSFLAVLLIGLTGCSMIEGGKNSVEYAQKTTDYINEVSQFANEAPELAKKAINDSASRKELENKLEEIQKDISSFNKLTPPDVAKEMHEQIVGYNETLSTWIDETMKKIENGKVDLEQFKDSEFMQTVQQVQELKNKIQNIGE
ncbi:DUF6376 family protein [Bacillus cytotoxicus]|uniref:DUF6376 family protein n=1 Tax=Bacillus cytotoxicus TaxID=580165 RepID=UPI00086442F3|nr:DUF6376 family protein [Bacillus cytotoxicus]AWC28412.1 hypothetical protein CG483_008520 [Bacillus cytotoxicus]AWC40203.1 hypothetical protein CG480_006730 [Bacillus cytotoxicus]AWC48134.1 hypothetical protein CG478_006730 [Bacillus cytotoxicus]AWC52479.1 hypothetical protein CG477_008480 [Bacillus cytotoxicus]AWC56612.1 hypothetical protein CG476_008510 [Bacillus cytotoxicus]